MKKHLTWFLVFFLIFLVIFILAPPFLPARLALEQILGLGSPSTKTITWENNGSSIKILNLAGENYRGKVMLVKIKDIKKIQVGLAQNGLGNVETTSSMAKRYGAIAAVNGGGFYNKTRNKALANYPVYVTIRNGHLISSINKSSNSTLAICITSSGKFLVDGTSSPQKLLELGAFQGVSFGPLLIENGQKVPVPKTRPDPRTAIGIKKDGTFIFVVIDGRQKGWSQGAAYEELQEIFLDLGAWQAVNLDGGGSSTMVFAGKVLNRPSDFTGERPIATSLLIFP